MEGADSPAAPLKGQPKRPDVPIPRWANISGGARTSLLAGTISNPGTKWDFF